MFVFNRPAFAVLLPLALLVAVVMFSNHAGPAPQAQTNSASTDQTVAANLPSR
ncbi:MAG: hypothetical protein ABI769_02780 [Pseudomonadota bacterium]